MRKREGKGGEEKGWKNGGEEKGGKNGGEEKGGKNGGEEKKKVEDKKGGGGQKRWRRKTSSGHAPSIAHRCQCVLFCESVRIPRDTTAKSAVEGWGPPTLFPSITTICRQNYCTKNPHFQAPRTPRPLNSVDATSAPPFFRRGWVGYTKKNSLLSEPSERMNRLVQTARSHHSHVADALFFFENCACRGVSTRKVRSLEKGWGLLHVPPNSPFPCDRHPSTRNKSLGPLQPRTATSPLGLLRALAPPQLGPPRLGATFSQLHQEARSNAT